MPDVFALTDRATVKSLLGITDATRDTEIDLLIRAVSGQIAQYCGRADAIERRSRTETFDVAPGQRVWQLRAYPVMSITDVRQDWNREFGASTVLDAETYTVRANSGLLTLDYPLVRFGGRRWAQIMRVTYTGGLATSLTALRSAHPDLELATHHQIQHYMKRKEGDPGQTTVNAGGASRTTPALDLLPHVKSILGQYVTHRMGNT